MSNAASPARHRDPAILVRALALALIVVLPSLLGAAMAYMVVALSLALAAIYLVRDPGRLSPEPAGKLLLIAFGLFVATSAVLAIIHRRPEEMSYVLNFLALALFVPLHAWLRAGARVGNAALVGRLALAGTVVCVAVAAYDMGVLGVERAGASTVDAIRFAATAMILGFVSLIGCRDSRGYARWLFVLGPVLGIFAVMLSGTRGAMLAIVPLAAVAIIYAVPGRRRALLVLLGLVVAGLAAVLTAELLGPSRLTSLVHTVGQVLAGQQPDDVSTGIRLAIYRAALEAFANSPWIGYGWSQLTLAPQPWFADPTPLSNYSHLHSDPLDFLVAIGLPGLVSYGLIIVAPMAGAWASPRDSQRPARLYGSAILSLGYLVSGQSSLMLGFEYQTVLYVGLAAILLGFCRDAPQTAAPPAA